MIQGTTGPILIAALGLALASPAWAQVSGGGSTGGGGLIGGPGSSSEIEWHTDEHSFSGSADIEPSDLLMAVFVVRDVKDHGGQLEWDAYSVEASLSVTTDCGAIKIDADWEALAGDVNQLGEQLVANLEKAAKAMPMLIICQVSPSLCAELKNLDFKIDSELGFRWDVCESINNFIDDKAQEGRQDAAARWYSKCVSDRTKSGMSEAVAQQTCLEDQKEELDEEGEDAFLVTSIAQGFLEEKVLTAPEKIIQAALQSAVGECSASSSGEVECTGLKKAMGDDYYEFLRGLVGEFELQVDGTIIPVFTERVPMTDMGDNIVLRAQKMCLSHNFPNHVEEDQAVMGGSTASPHWYFVSRIVEDVYQEHTTPRNAENLEYLRDYTPGVHEMYCMELGKAAAAQVGVRVDGLGRDGLLLAMGNPAVNERVEEVLLEAAVMTESLKSYLHTTTTPMCGADDTPVACIGKVSLAIERHAEQLRAVHRSSGDALTVGEQVDALLNRDRSCRTVLECSAE